MIRVAIMGVGRIGKILIPKILEKEDMLLVAAIDKDRVKSIGKEIGIVIDSRENYGIIVTPFSELDKTLKEKRPDVLIDFSSPNALINSLPIIADNKVNLVIGTTGFNNSQIEKIKSFQEKIGIIYAPNLTLGINLLLTITKLISKVWPEADVDIVESHLRDKRDIPSGSAKLLAQAASNRKKKISTNTEDSRGDNSVIVHSIRSGNMRSKHQVIFSGKTQILTITHEELYKSAYAVGAIKAARWIKDRKGFHKMEEVEGLDKLGI